jgi:MFS family permease
MEKLKLKFKKFNKVVLFLTLADVFTWGPFFILSSLAGLYLSDKLGQDTISFVGLGTGISFITRAVFQIPIGRFSDKLKKDKDEILLLMLGTILAGASFTLYPLIKEPWHYYFLQFLFGLGISLDIVNWRKLFAINVTKGMEGEEYAIYDTVLSTASAILAVIMGIIANLGNQYFDIVMILSGIIMMTSSFWVFSISKVKKRKSEK